MYSFVLFCKYIALYAIFQLLLACQLDCLLKLAKDSFQDYGKVLTKT